MLTPKFQKKLQIIVAQFSQLYSKEFVIQFLFLFLIQQENLFQMQIINCFGLEKNLNYMLDLRLNKKQFSLMAKLLEFLGIYFGFLKAFISLLI
nr:MAG TPA: hypothetical protein [Caudoviricetes sp.]